MTTPAPRIFRIIVPVLDLEQGVRFYADLLGAPGQRVSPGRHYIDCGGVILALYHAGLDGDEGPFRPLPDHVYFACAELETFHARATALGCLRTDDVHGAASGAIAKRPWGERLFYAQDPFGTRLCFVDDTTLFTGR